MQKKSLGKKSIEFAEKSLVQIKDTNNVMNMSVTLEIRCLTSLYHSRSQVKPEKIKR